MRVVPASGGSGVRSPMLYYKPATAMTRCVLTNICVYSKVSKCKDAPPSAAALTAQVERLERELAEQTAWAKKEGERADRARERANEEKERADDTVTNLAAAVKAAVEAALAGVREGTTAAVTTAVELERAEQETRRDQAVVAAVELERAKAQTQVREAVVAAVKEERAKAQEDLTKQEMVVNMVLFTK